MIRINRALLSVSDKTGLGELARVLHNHGVELYATGGTSAFLQQENIPVTSIDELTEHPEMLDGRVKTLHPAVHAGLLMDRQKAKHQEELAAAGYQPFDMVVVNLYPFAKRQAEGRSEEELVEAIDIGGVTLLRAAAKNHRNVVAVSDPKQYPLIIRELNQAGSVKKTVSRQLAAAAFRLTAEFDAGVTRSLLTGQGECLLLEERLPLRYGENPHQAAVLLGPDSHLPLTKLQGKEISYNNILDLDTALWFLSESKKPSAIVIKHGNPCGVRENGKPLALYKGAVAGDPTAAFGGVLGFNCPIDAVTAHAILERFWEVILAPAFTAEVKEILAAKPKLLVLEIEPENLHWPVWEFRSTAIGILKQQPDRHSGLGTAKVVSKRQPTEQELQALNLAIRVCKFVRSNAIVISGPDEIYGVGAGQMSRIEACGLAIKLARDGGRPLRGSVLASDGFFPFRDTIDLSVAAGITVFVEPGGSMRDEESIAAADEHDAVLVFTGTRHFRH